MLTIRSRFFLHFFEEMVSRNTLVLQRMIVDVANR